MVSTGLSLGSTDVAGDGVGRGVGLASCAPKKNRAATTPMAAKSNKIIKLPPSSTTKRLLRRGGVGRLKAVGAKGAAAPSWGGSWSDDPVPGWPPDGGRYTAPGTGATGGWGGRAKGSGASAPPPGLAPVIDDAGLCALSARGTFGTPGGRVTGGDSGREVDNEGNSLPPGWPLCPVGRPETPLGDSGKFGGGVAVEGMD